ncbi:MAG: YIP1 family protein [Candidatus Bathyarchaeia archaeon]
MSRFLRMGSVVVNPKRAFNEIAESPDFFGLVFVLAASVLASLGAQYVLWTTKITFFDVDLGKVASPAFPYAYYGLSELFSFGVVYLGRNFVMYYILSWVLRGERDAGLLLACTGYTLVTQLVGRLIQVFLSYAAFPSVRYQVSTETSIVLLTASVQQVLAHQENWARTTAFNQEAALVWQMSAAVKGFSYFTYVVNAWTALVAIPMIYAVTRLSWRLSAAGACAVLALDTAFFVYSLI